MELNDILALIKAGFTKDELIQLTNPVQAESVPTVEPVQEQETNNEPTAEQSAVGESVPQSQTVPQTPQDKTSLGDVMQAIAKLTGAIQANAISQSIMPMTTPVQAEDIMAEIIRPTFKGKEV